MVYSLQSVALSLLVVLGVASRVDESLYAPTPNGWCLRACMHEVAPGTHLSELPDGTLKASHPDGTVTILPLCDTKNGTLPMMLPNTDDSLGRYKTRRSPQAYDGWLAYTEFNVDPSTETFDAFLGYFSVPDNPAGTPSVLYIFTGLQNIDWIPVVDPTPDEPFDIIQPVLQYPGDRGHYWSIKSWYVTLTVGTTYSKEVQVAAGDNIYGNMTRTASDTWFIDSVSSQTGESTSITVSHSRLTSQPWAYNTIECYGCNGCKTYPDNDCAFTELELLQGSNTVTPEWLINPKPSSNTQCNETVEVLDNGATVNFYFQYAN